MTPQELQVLHSRFDQAADQLLVNLARLILIEEGLPKEEAIQRVKNQAEAERVIAVRA